MCEGDLSLVWKHTISEDQIFRKQNNTVSQSPTEPPTQPPSKPVGGKTREEIFAGTGLLGKIADGETACRKPEPGRIKNALNKIFAMVGLG